MSYKKLYSTPEYTPIEISTDAEMAAVLLDDNNLGKVYKFTGTSGTYINGDLYEVEVKPRVTDLTNTTWWFPEDGSTVEYSSTVTSYTITWLNGAGSSKSTFVAPFLTIGITFKVYTYYREGMSFWGWSTSTSDPNWVDGGSTNPEARKITFTGGTDVTNTTLIDWLYANAELQS